MQDSTHKRRSQRLIPGSFQLRVALGLAGLAALALAIQFLYMSARMMVIVQAMDGSAESVQGALPAVLLEVFVLSSLVLMPLLFLVAIVTTFRIAGPLYALERYLLEVANGRDMHEFKTRKSDRIDGLRDAVNSAIKTLKENRVDQAA